MSGTHPPILAVIDLASEQQPAVARAADYAARVRAPLILLACIFDPFIAGEQVYPGIDLKRLRQGALGDQLRRQRKLAKACAARGIEVRCRAVFDHPLNEAIVREVLRASPALVVKDTHHHSALSRVLYTHTDWHLIRDCPAPLWLVKQRPHEAHGTIVAAVDPLHRNDKPADLDRHIVDIAQEIGFLHDARVHVVHATPPTTPPVGAALPIGAIVPADVQVQIEAANRRAHAESLDRFVAAIGIPEPQVHLREGRPEDVIAAVADETNAHAVVMGAVSRSRIRRAFIGSTAERVLEALPTDLVIVKPAGFISPVSPRARAAGYMARSATVRSG